MTRSPLISAEELRDLTGYEKAYKQCEQLDEWLVPYKLRKDGTPALTWAQWDSAFASPRARNAPRFDHLERKAG